VKQTFNKQERLCSKIQINLLFNKGKHKVQYPLKMILLETPVNLEYTAQAMFIVPKRQFKKAHDRNLLKRRMREAYRLNKDFFYNQLTTSNKKVIVAFLYVGKKEEDYTTIDSALKKLLG
jgi:ribonuclease P protein component